MGIHDQDQDPRTADRGRPDEDTEGHIRMDPEKLRMADAEEDVEGHRVLRVNPDTYPDESNPTP